tara:strand:+ start:33 stop:407 length:375 start_codon:yes stop_codon:yes gene_type:complete
MDIEKKKPRPIVGIIPTDSVAGSTLLNKKFRPTSITRGTFKLFDKLQKTNPALADQLLEEVQSCEDNARLVGRKAEFTSDRTREQANNILEIFRTWSRNDLSAFKSLVKSDKDFKDCVITKIKK